MNCCSFPIDFVITWVDGNDPEWNKQKDECEREFFSKHNSDFKVWSASSKCFRDWDSLKYWFRGVEQFASWVNKIHFVTAGHLPAWLNTHNKKLNIVKHADFMPKEYLPTFNSIAIEWNLHRINGLSEQFVYFNDDMFVISKVTPKDFFNQGLPCETAGLACCVTQWNKGHEEYYNAMLINKYFNKKSVIKKNIGKWIRLEYKDVLIRTLLLLSWREFTGFFETHGSCAYKKQTFEEIWDKEGIFLDEVCKSRFRNANSANHWLVKNWQVVSGLFSPRKRSFHKVFTSGMTPEAYKYVVKHKAKTVCINDSNFLSDDQFNEQKALMKAAFEKILPNKSSFEL